LESSSITGAGGASGEESLEDSKTSFVVPSSCVDVVSTEKEEVESLCKQREAEDLRRPLANALALPKEVEDASKSKDEVLDLRVISFSPWFAIMLPSSTLFADYGE
jgi:hypothetical protein